MAIMFDLDGTLINSTSLHLKAMRNAVKTTLGENVISEKFIENTVRYPLRKVFEMIRTKYGKDFLPKTKENEIKRKKAAFFNQENLKKLAMFRGVNRIPKLLDGLGINFCVVTSMSDEELSKFANFMDLDKISKLIINPPGMRYEKPNPYTLNKAIRIMKANKKKTVYIGDSPYDAIASKRAGIKFIGVHNARELKKLGEFYKDIPDLLEEIKKNPSRFRD